MMPGDLVFVDGDLVSRSEARVSVMDRGFLYGDSIFETIRVTRGEPVFLHDHLERLERSAAAVGLTLPHDRTAFSAIVRDTVAANDVEEAACRLTVTRGEGRLGLSARHARSPTVVVLVEPVIPDPARLARGLHLIVSRHRKLAADESDIEAKTGNYLVGILAKMEAEARGADDALHLNARGEIVEATTANLFVVDHEGGDSTDAGAGAGPSPAPAAVMIRTPDLSCGPLPGLTRSRILGLAHDRGYTVEESSLRVEDLRHAREAFLTSTIAGVMPVTRFEDAPVGDGKPGPVTLALHEAERAQAIERKPRGKSSL